MSIVVVKLVFISASLCHGQLTPARRYKHNQENIAKYGDAQHRGVRWYAYSSISKESGTASILTSDSLGTYSKEQSDMSHSSDASSAITADSKVGKKKYRKCTKCPSDMLKRYDNRGIKWICGQYQRARRSFKSECMMRFRNCEDGTMFVKMQDHRCKDSNFHGRHWFYIYKI